MLQYQLALPEPASARIETLLHGQTCPAHPGTTLDGGICAVCELNTDIALHGVAEAEAVYAPTAKPRPQGPNHPTDGYSYSGCFCDYCEAIRA